MKKWKTEILSIILFLILIPIIIIVYSYIPTNMVKLSTDSEWEYFYENILCNISLKLVIAILVSGIASGIMWYRIRKMKR